MISPRQKLPIEVEPSAIIRNITNFFSDELACISEYLQNCRRAEAARVDIELDYDNATLRFKDDGQGVPDYRALITIGKSDWASKTAVETPAGMGLFSGFKLGDRITVRSDTWEMDIDFAKRGLYDAVDLRSCLPKVKGTVVTIHLNALGLERLRSELAHNTDSAKQRANSSLFSLASYAKFMPFTTVIAVLSRNDVATSTIPAFTPYNKLFGSLYDKVFPWGSLHLFPKDKLDVYGKSISTDTSVKRSFIAEHTMTCQGLDFDLTNFDFHNVRESHGVIMFIVVNPGEVDFSLPDRDKILTNDKFQKLNAAVMDAAAEAWLTAIKTLNKNPEYLVKETGKLTDDGSMLERRLAAMFADNFDDRRDQLPARLQYLRLSNGRHARDQIHSMIMEKTLFHPDTSSHDDNLVFLIRQNYGSTKLAAVDNGNYDVERKWAAKLFPGAKFVDGFLYHAEQDPRNPYRLCRITKAEMFCIDENAKVERRAMQVPDKHMVYYNDELEPLGLDDLITPDGYAKQALRESHSIIVSEDDLSHFSEGVLHTWPLDKPITDSSPEFGHQEDSFSLGHEDDNGHDPRTNWYETDAYYAITETREGLVLDYPDLESMLAYMRYLAGDYVSFKGVRRAKVSFDRDGILIESGVLVFYNYSDQKQRVSKFHKTLDGYGRLCVTVENGQVTRVKTTSPKKQIDLAPPVDTAQTTC